MLICAIVQVNVKVNVNVNVKGVSLTRCAG